MLVRVCTKGEGTSVEVLREWRQLPQKDKTPKSLHARHFSRLWILVCGHFTNQSSWMLKTHKTLHQDPKKHLVQQNDDAPPGLERLSPQRKILASWAKDQSFLASFLASSVTGVIFFKQNKPLIVHFILLYMKKDKNAHSSRRHQDAIRFTEPLHKAWNCFSCFITSHVQVVCHKSTRTWSQNEVWMNNYRNMKTPHSSCASIVSSGTSQFWSTLSTPSEPFFQQNNTIRKITESIKTPLEYKTTRYRNHMGSSWSRR